MKNCKRTIENMQTQLKNLSNRKKLCKTDQKKKKKEYDQKN